jgi:predicted PurR-regulated permease PerM
MPAQHPPNGFRGPPQPPKPLLPPAHPFLGDSLGDIARRVAVLLLVGLVMLALALLAWRGVHVLLQAFAGVLFAIFLAALSTWFSERTGLSYCKSLAVVVVVLFALAGGVGWLLASRVALQVGELSQELPRSFTAIKGYLEEHTWGKMLLEHVPGAAGALDLQEMSAFTRTTGLISGVFDFGVSALLILFVGIFGAAEPGLYKAGLLHLVPRSYRPRAGETLDAVAYNLRWWLVGQFVLMVLIGATTALGLWLIGVPLALTLGVIAGVMEMVPYLGPWISAIPAALIALLVSPAHLVLTLGLFLFLHIVEGYLLLPLIQRRAVHLPPALTPVAQVLLGEVLGLLGLFVAAPLTVSGVVILKMLYVEDTLGDQAVDVPGEPGNAEKQEVPQGPDSPSG